MLLDGERCQESKYIRGINLSRIRPYAGKPAISCDYGASRLGLVRSGFGLRTFTRSRLGRSFRFSSSMSNSFFLRGGSGGGSSIANRHRAVLLTDGRRRAVIGGRDAYSGADLLNDSSLRGIVGILVKLGIRSHLLHPQGLGRIRGRGRVSPKSGPRGRRGGVVLPCEHG